MDKPTNKKNIYEGLIIERLIGKYGVSKRFVTMSLNNDRKSDTSISIKKDYPIMLKAVRKFLKQL